MLTAQREAQPSILALTSFIENATNNGKKELVERLFEMTTAPDAQRREYLDTLSDEDVLAQVAAEAPAAAKVVRREMQLTRREQAHVSCTD